LAGLSLLEEGKTSFLEEGKTSSVCTSIGYPAFFFGGIVVILEDSISESVS
jgi:hypothetical protein